MLSYIVVDVIFLYIRNAVWNEIFFFNKGLGCECVVTIQTMIFFSYFVLFLEKMLCADLINVINHGIPLNFNRFYHLHWNNESTKSDNWKDIIAEVGKVAKCLQLALKEISWNQTREHPHNRIADRQEKLNRTNVKRTKVLNFWSRNHI